MEDKDIEIEVKILESNVELLEEVLKKFIPFGKAYFTGKKEAYEEQIDKYKKTCPELYKKEAQGSKRRG